jgi:signal peptidase I
VRRIACLLGAAVAAGVATSLTHRLLAYRIDDHSMEPTLHPGDYVLGVRRRHVRPGEVVVFDHPRRPGFEMVKRVVAGPGQQVGQITLGSGEFWVRGDNRAAGSVDSRAMGPIPLERLRARLFCRYRPGPPGWVR